MATTHPEAPDTRHGATQSAEGIIGKVRERATAQLTAQKDRAVEGIGSVTSAVRQSTQQLRDQQHDTLAGYVEQAANAIDRLSEQLRAKDLGELFEDAQRLARRQPALFIGSAFALGLIGARFLKSSSRSNGHTDYQAPGDYQAPRSGFTRSSYPAAGTTSARDYPSSGTPLSSRDRNPGSPLEEAVRPVATPTTTPAATADLDPVTSPRVTSTSRSRTSPRSERS